MKKICYLFPGQGSQYVGMGKDFYDRSSLSKAIFDEAEEVLKAQSIDIKRLCFEGPIEELTQTSNSQVCILVVSIAALQALHTHDASRITHHEVIACAGLSLGELTALVAGKSLRFKDALYLVRCRGKLMEDASTKNPGTMASIIGLSLNEVNQICRISKVDVANLNCPGQIVISGSKDAVTSSIELAIKRGAKKAIPLNVSGPFHSSLMKEISVPFKLALDKVEISTPEIGVVSNVTSDYEKTPSEIKENLVQQLYSPVRWEESIRRIASQGVDTFLEIGPGTVIKGLLRRIDANLKVYNIEKMEDIRMNRV